MYHHPAYSAGTHVSDVEIEMIEMRTLYKCVRLLPRLMSILRSAPSCYKSA